MPAWRPPPCPLDRTSSLQKVLVQQGSHLLHQTLLENFEHTRRVPWQWALREEHQRRGALEACLGEEEHQRHHPCQPTARQCRLVQEEGEHQRQQALGACQVEDHRERHQERRPSLEAVALEPCLVIGGARQCRHRPAVPAQAAASPALGQVFPWRLCSPPDRPAHRGAHQVSACRRAGCSSKFQANQDDGP